MTVDVCIFTNEDITPIPEWPTQLCCRPEKGDRILSVCGRKSRIVCGITHSTITRNGRTFPCLDVEVTKVYGGEANTGPR